MKIDRAMYFIYTTVNKGNNDLISLSKRFFTYWKLQNLYGTPTRDLYADNMVNGFLELNNEHTTTYARDLYVLNQINVVGTAEIEFDVHEVECEADSVSVENLNAVSIEGETPDIDDLEEEFRDTISEQASEMEWYTENVSAEVTWDNVECDLVEPSDDDTVSYLYEKGLAYESRDISEFIEDQIMCINDNNKGMTPDAYVNFMLGELKAQMNRRNTPVDEPSVSDNQIND